ncbi:hypothetical protein [Mitsuaria sp. GD03876]|uniref:hypothetical protein n=1 Tax=Mitsuaria sp. GD03876 TaxID=2975399 RepID=UPI00244B5734|nr:hypothetical protein [Mitsuaria sp. GD03876]MDH0864383.1 hypothetical protein [Mitsuaria sp. GD03876]
MTTPFPVTAGRTAPDPANRWRRPALRLTAIAAATLVAGCFGGGGDDATDMPGQPAGGAIPDSALASPAAYTQFTLTTAQSGSETAEPLTADNVTVPPTSETDEPAPVT